MFTAPYSHIDQQALQLVLDGKAEAIPDRDGLVMFEFDEFGLLMREDYTTVAGD